MTDWRLALLGRQMRRQLIATSLAVALVLLAIDGVRLGEDLPRDLLVVAVGVARGVRLDLFSGKTDRS